MVRRLLFPDLLPRTMSRPVLGLSPEQEGHLRTLEARPGMRGSRGAAHPVRIEAQRAPHRLGRLGASLRRRAGPEESCIVGLESPAAPPGHPGD